MRWKELLTAVVAGAIGGAVGAGILAGVSLWAEAVYGWLAILPFLSAAFPVAIVYGDGADAATGGLAALIGAVSMGYGYNLMLENLGPLYRYEPSGLDLLWFVVGLYLAYQIASGAPDEADRETEAAAPGKDALDPGIEQGEETSTGREPGRPTEAGEAGLTKSRSKSLVTGTLGGIGEHVGIHPHVVRAGFVGAAILAVFLFQERGLLAAAGGYLVAALLLEDAPESRGPQDPGSA